MVTLDHARSSQAVRAVGARDGVSDTRGRHALELAAVSAVSLLVGFAVQVAATLAAVATAEPATPARVEAILERYDTSLLSTSHGLRDYAGLVGHNLLSFAAFGIVGLLLAGWKPPRIPVRTRTGFAVLGVLVAYVSLTVVRQNALLVELFGAWGHNPSGTPRIMLVLCLPHGPLEFGALALPLLAAARPMLRSRVAAAGVCAVAVALLLTAAALETWVSPVLLQFATTGVRPS